VGLNLVPTSHQKDFLKFWTFKIVKFGPFLGGGGIVKLSISIIGIIVPGIGAFSNDFCQFPQIWDKILKFGVN